MKTINVKARISGGTAPMPINVQITNIDTDEIVRFESKTSFNKDFNLDSGTYTIQLYGMNPIDGNTEILLSGNFIEGPYYSSKRTTKKTFISELFYGKI